GYPGAADTFNSGVLDSKSALEASITDGKVSATNKKSSSGAPILQVSAPATHGNSGGPVMTDKGEVVGLLTFGGDRVNNQEVSGFVFVVPSSTVQEFVKAAGVANALGPADTAYREGLELYWDQRYSKAIPKFEEVKRLFPEHSEVARLIQSSQQSIAEGKERSSLPGMWTIVIAVLVILFLIVAILVIGLTILFIARKRSKSKTATAVAAASMSTPPPAPAGRASAPPPPAPSPSYSPSPKPAPPMPEVATAGADRSLTVDLSRTIAIGPDGDTGPISYGSIKFVSGVLAGKQFDVKPDGAYIGRDASVSQIVLPDPRISKRHLWIGVRDGNVMITDDGSRNGTFVNDPKSSRVTQTVLNPGDVVILGESDVARFEFQR
ncbi:MAG: FHA domain-containing protein, partial [Pyrinomonadaceae bacterium]